MALLNRFRTRFTLALLASTVAGCAFLDAWRERQREFGFSHRVHVADQALDCGDCHASDDGARVPSLPSLAACNLCHAELDAEVPPERKIATLFDGGAFRATRRVALSSEIVFDHDRHTGAGLECAACHAGMDANERVGELAPPAMDACSRCHVERSVANECSTCHSELGPERAPESHSGAWVRAHGGVVRAKDDATASRCDLCHTEASCSSCHFETAPANHGGHWRTRGHGLVASMDRQSCATCHQSDSCDSCHATVEPKSHSATWGAPRDRHCTSCHFPLRDEGCSTCHVATPSHALATPKPPAHDPAMNCRQCHGNGQPLPHADNGDDCNYCHQ